MSDDRSVLAAISLFLKGAQNKDLALTDTE